MARETGDADRSRWERFADEVGRKEARKIRGRAERRRSAWFWAGMFGLVGWSVAVPTLLGLYLGVKLDDWVPGPASWTLTGLLVGLAVGCLNAWYWVRRESRREE
jgi:ATP synthase protein I